MIKAIFEQIVLVLQVININLLETTNHMLHPCLYGVVSC